MGECEFYLSTKKLFAPYYFFKMAKATVATPGLIMVWFIAKYNVDKSHSPVLLYGKRRLCLSDEAAPDVIQKTQNQ